MNTIAFQRPASRVSHMRRPLNCDFETSLEKRCPHCKQNHLTAGYCQALDPINAEEYPHLHGQKGETLSAVKAGDETLTETLSENETLNQCAECGDPFQASRASARYCSSACRLKAHRAAAKQIG